jgi:hypothetical protein
MQTLIDGLNRYLAEVEQRTERTLTAQAQRIEALLKSTTAHGDVTGATRASYTTSVIGGSSAAQAQASAAFGRAVAVVEQLNPGTSDTAQGSIGDDSIGLVLYAPTDYQIDLETERAGQKATLGPTIRLVARDVTEAVARG